MNPAKFIRCPIAGYGNWKLECDPTQAFKDDPGAGTPLIVTAPNGQTGTIYCALGEGVVSGDDQEIPANVYKWLESIADDAEAYVWEGNE